MVSFDQAMSVPVESSYILHSKKLIKIENVRFVVYMENILDDYNYYSLNP